MTGVGRNAGALLAARVIGALGNLLLAALVAARLGSAGFGTFAALVAGGAVANLAITFGVDVVVVRAVADRRPDAAATIRRALVLQLLGAGVVLAAAGALVTLLGWPSVILIPAATLVPLGVTTVAGAVLRGAQRMATIPLAALLTSVVSLVLAVALVDDRVGMAVAAVAAGHAVGAVALAIPATTIVRSGRRAVASGADAAVDAGGSWRLGRLVAESWVFAAATVATAVMVQGALIVYEAMGDGDAGGLAAGMRLTETARLVPASAFAALFPAMFDGVHRSADYRRLYAAMLGYAVVAAAAIAALAPVLSEQLFDDPPNGVVIIRILGLGLVATVVRLRYSFELIAVGRERLVLAVAVTGAAVALVGAVIGATADRLVLVAVVQVATAALSAAALAAIASRAGDRGEGSHPSNDSPPGTERSARQPRGTDRAAPS